MYSKYYLYNRAPDELLTKCTHMLTIDGMVLLMDDISFLILGENKKMASKALRVLGLAIKETEYYCCRFDFNIFINWQQAVSYYRDDYGVSHIVYECNISFFEF